MPDDVPVDKVLQMKTQGLTNSQIIEALERQGYNPNQIFDAMNQADMKASIEKAPQLEDVQVRNPINPDIPPNIQSQQSNPADPTTQSYYQQSQTLPNQASGQAIPQPQAQGDYYDYQGLLDAETEKIEQIAEAIIDEKWEELVESINKVIEWKEKTEQRITQLEQQIKDLREEMTQLQKGIMDKMAEYDQHVLDVGTEIKAMETVFKKVLPIFTSNVKELSKIVKELKER